MITPPRRLLHDGLICAAADPQLQNKPALIVHGKANSYAELFNAATRLATTLRAVGVQRGDRVAIYMDNTWPCVVSIYAAALAGAAFLLVNPQTKADKLAFILADSGAKVLLTDSHLSAQFVSALEQTPQAAHVICSGEPLAAAVVQSFASALAIEPRIDGPGTIPLDLAALIYTSGSTGQPKGVMQTHQAMVFSIGSLTEYLRLEVDDRILCALPLAFDYGLYQLLMSVDLGATLVLERSFTYPAQVFARMHEHAVSVFPGVPTVFAMLLSAHAREALRFETVKCITNTAAALPDDVALRLREIFPHALIFKMYGLTECKRVSFLQPECLERKPGSVGQAIPGTEVYLLSETGESVAPGETGILHVRGPHVMLGYWNRAQETERMLRAGKLPGERVLCTQDRFRQDPEGYLYFVGRSDDIIKTRGEKVSPVEVENVLHAIPGIREAAVIGVSDALLGEAIRAFVVTEPGVGLDPRRIRAHCAAQLENFMVPRDIEFVDDLPRTDTGKVSKKVLREQSTPHGRANNA